MEQYYPHIALTVAVCGFFFAHFRTRANAELSDRCTKLETKLDLIIQFAFKNAVLDFHSPDPAHKKSDTAIERLVQGEELSTEEIKAITERIKTVVVGGEDSATRLKAELTLAMMDEFIGVIGAQSKSAVSELE